MLAVHCPRHGRRVLLMHDDIDLVRSTPTGAVVDWTCFCGQRGSTTISRARRSDPAH